MITTTLEVAAAILAVEFALLVPLVAYFTLRGARSSEAVTTSEATELVTKVADTEDARRLALETVFRDKYKYDGDELTAAVDEFMEREKAFYNAVVGAVLGRGESKISDINDELTKVVAPWISITPKNMVDAASAEAVAAEKDRIEIELGTTKDTLEKMIAEYNRAFRIDSTEAAMTVDVAPGPGEAEPEPEPVSEPAPEPESAFVEEDDAEIDYKTEELNDLDDVLESIVANKPAVDDAPLADDAIVNLDEDDDDDDLDPEYGNDSDTAVAGSADEIAELESLDELDDDVLGVTPGQRAGKPMTADDLDELMESLDADTADETEPV